jgi:hypothetical protein
VNFWETFKKSANSSSTLRSTYYYKSHANQIPNGGMYQSQANGTILRAFFQEVKCYYHPHS